MGFLDIILGVLSLLRCLKASKMAFCKLASLVSLLLGIYAAVKFSNFMKMFLAGFVVESQYYTSHSFILTFILVVIAVSLLGKFLTGIADLAFRLVKFPWRWFL
jgi:membrane protein required for colicin V production